MLAFKMTEESLDRNAQANPSIRISVSINDEKLSQDLDLTRLDRFFKNSLQDSNLQLTLIYRDPVLNDN